MTQQIIFEGATAKLVNTEVINEFDSDDFISKIAEMVPLTAGPLPHNCLFYQSRSVGGAIHQTFAIERLPGMYEMKYLPKGESQDRIKTFNLWWPHVLWWVVTVGNNVDKVYLTACVDPRVNGHKTPLFYLPTNNQYQGSANFCCGNLSVDINQPLVVNIEKLIAHLEGSLWNDDLVTSFRNTNIESFNDWAAKSKNGPFDLKLPTWGQPTVARMCKWIAARMERITDNPDNI